MVGANNVAFDSKKSPRELAHADVAKEMIIRWDPDLIFLDLSTLQIAAGANALFEIRNDPLYRELDAVKKGNVYGLLPYNWYTKNFGSILGNAYYIGTILHPDAFNDIDPRKKTDEIYRFLIGKEVFQEMDEQFGKMVFRKISVETKK
jgi:iron complex transport system substrate-binding protein